MTRPETQRAVNGLHFALWLHGALKGGAATGGRVGLSRCYGLLLAGLITLCATAVQAAPAWLSPDQVLTALDDGTSQGEEVGDAVAIQGDVAVIGVPGDDNGRGGLLVYTWNGERWQPQQVVKAPVSDTIMPGRFGDTLVMAGGRLTVGAPFSHTPAGERAGAVYVYDITGPVWTLLEVVTSPEGRSQGQFGHSISVTDQFMVVAGNNAAYAFARKAGAWAAEAVLLPPERFSDWPGMLNRPLQPYRPGHDPLFDYGNDVAVSGTTALVGAPGHQSVYVFVKAGGVWRLQSRIISPRPAPGTVSSGSTNSAFPPPSQDAYQVYDEFGCAVALQGDTALIGALGGSSVGLHGAAYVFRRTGSAWVKHSEFNPDSTHSSFGRRVVLTPERALIGSYHVDRPNSAPNGSSRGAVYVYNVAPVTWVRSAILDAPFDRAGVYGDGIAISGNRVIAGDVGLPAPYLSVALESGTPFPIVDGGAAHVFLFNGASWVRQQTIAPRASGLAAENKFGHVVATSGDSAVIGMPADRHTGSNPGGLGVGSVLVFHRGEGGWTQLARLSGTPGQIQFGSCVAMDGDTLAAGYPMGMPHVYERNGNGIWTATAVLPTVGNAVAVSGGYIFVGNREAIRTGVGATGHVAVYAKQGGAWTLAATLYAADGAPGDQFGHCLAVDGSTLAVGAPEQDQRGAVYFFQLGDHGWEPQAKLDAQAHASIGARFGFSAALQGNQLVTGQPMAGPTDAGSAFVFVRGQGNVWTLASHLQPPQATPDAHFGWSVAVQDPAVLVGEPYGLTADGQAHGIAHLYRRSGDQWAPAARLAEAAGSPSAGSARHQLGTSVAMAGPQALVGAPEAGDLFGSPTGTVSAFTLLGLPQIQFFVNGQPVTSGQAVDFGESSVGSSNSRVINLVNISGAPITGITLALGGAQGGEAGLVSALANSTLNPGFSTNVGVFFAPAAAGIRSATLTVSSPDLDPAVPALADLTILGTATDAAPQITVPPQAQVAVVGDEVAFHVQATGTGTLGYQWLKNGRAIAGANSPTLSLPAARTTDAARYSVEVSNAQGKVASEPVGLVIFNKQNPITLVVKEGTPLIFKGPTATGSTPVTLGWTLNGDSLAPAPGQIPGARLDFGPATAALDGAVFALHATPSSSSGSSNKTGTTSRQIARYTLRIVYPPLLLPHVIGPWTVAGQVQGKLLAINGISKYTATGLPPGVTLSPTTGNFSGQPTVPGTYTVLCRGWNDAGAGPELALPVTVLPLPGSVQGAFDGLFGDNDGRFSAQITPSGQLTTQALFQGKSYRRTAYIVKGSSGIYHFSTQLYADNGRLVSFPTAATLRVRLLPTSRSAAGGVDLTPLINTGGGGGTVQPDPYPITHIPLIAYRNLWINSGLTTPQAGRFTARLSGGQATHPYDQRPQPQGDGYAAMTLSPTGSITWSGRMSDGTIATGSSTSLELGRVPLFLPLAMKGIVQGWLEIPQEEPLGNATLQGTLLWDGGGPRTTRNYPDSFLLHEIEVSGGRYLPPAKNALPTGFTASLPNASLSFSQAGLDGIINGTEIDFTLPPSGKPVLPAPGQVPARTLTLLRFTVTPATGLFSGAFRINTALPGQPAARRDVSFQGLLVQPLEGHGYGYFLLPETNAKSALLLSGKVHLSPYSIRVLDD